MQSVNFYFVVALYFLVNALAFGQQTNDNHQALVDDLEQARNQGNMELADTLAEQLIAQLKLGNNSSMLAEAYYQQARNAMERNDYAKAHPLFERSVELFQESGNKLGLAKTYRNIGLTFRYQSNYSSALDYIYLAMQIFQQVDDRAAIGSTYNSIGVVLEKMGQYEEAFEAHRKALEIHHEMEDDSGVASALYNLGDLRRQAGDHDTALQYFKDALNMDLAAKEPKNIAYSHNKIGFQYAILGDLEKARFHVLEAVSLFQQIQAPRDSDWALSSLAKIEMESANFLQAQQIINGVIERAIANDYHSLLVDAYRIAAELAYRQEQSEKALLLIQLGLDKAILNDEQHDEALLQALKVKVLLQNDQLKEAFDALTKQKQIDDQRFNQQRIDTIANAQAQTEFIRRAQQIDILKKEKALQQARIEQQETQRNLWLLATTASFIVLLLLYSRYTQRRLNKHLGEQVEARTQELRQKNQQLKSAYKEMEAISLTDKLTGINNRRYLENHLQIDLDQSMRQYTDWHEGKAGKPSQADIVVFLIDMDHFKQTNDKYGHNAGDKVLKQLTARMAQVFRQTDYLVRWGGEEFVAIARFTDRNEAPALAQRMLDSVKSTPFDIDHSTSITQSCSIGYACFPLSQQCNHDVHWHKLISLADNSLYAAKRSGRGHWVGIETVVDANLDLSTMTQTEIQQLVSQQKIDIKSSIPDNLPIVWEQSK